jgi:hypothetical protein
VVDREKVKVLAMEAKEQENLMMRNIANKYSEEDNIKALARQVQCSVAYLSILTISSLPYFLHFPVFVRIHTQEQEFFLFQFMSIYLDKLITYVDMLSHYTA